MQPVLSTWQMREADRLTIESGYVSALDLMESAGQAVVDLILESWSDPAVLRVAVLCGKGNNGGDGFVIARLLAELGADVVVVATDGRENMSVSAQANFDRLRSVQSAGGRVAIASPSEWLAEAPNDLDLVVDALLGTGLDSELKPPVSDLVARLNGLELPVIAVDIPTGLHSDTGLVLGAAVTADATVTMGATKTGLVLNEGPSVAGIVVVADIGIQPKTVERVQETGRTFLVEDDDIPGWLPKRQRDAHKYSVGMLLCVGGSVGMTGAPVLAASAAARIGAGVVVCASPRSVQPILATKLTEIMTVGLDEDANGLMYEPTAQVLDDRLERASAVLIGCGLGRAPGTRRFVFEILARLDQPAVIDADALFALAEDPAFIARHSDGRWVLTPHRGEFARLAGDVDLTNPVDAGRRFAASWNCVVLLKGNPSIVCAPNGDVWINQTGGSHAASAGTGDVLAGLIAGLLAQGMPPARAAITGLYIGGAAADRYLNEASGRSLMASDVIAHVPPVIKERFEK